MESQQPASEIIKWVREDGSVLCMMPYAAWDPPDRTACLDGNFSAAELRALADWMEARSA